MKWVRNPQFILYAGTKLPLDSTKETQSQTQRRECFEAIAKEQKYKIAFFQESQREAGK